MGKKMREKDGQKRENKQIEEGNSAEKEIDVLNVSTENRVDDKNEKEDHKKKRKAELDTDIKEYQKAHKKHKKSKDVVEVEEISKETCLGGKENTEQEGIEAINLENNGEAKWARRGKHKKQKDVIHAVATVAETLEHSEVQEPVEVQKICSPKDTGKMVHGKEEAYKKRKKKKQKPEKANGVVADDIEVMSSIADENVTSEENPAGNEIECRKLRDISGDTEDGNRQKKKSKSVENNGEEKRDMKGKHKKKKDVIDAVATVAETLEHSKVQEPVEVQKICSPGDTHKMVHGKEEAYKKRKKKKQKPEKVNGDVADDIEVMSSMAGETVTSEENSAGNEIECRKLRDISGDTEDGNRRKKKSKSVKKDSEGGHHEADARNRSFDPTNQVENATPKDKLKKVSFCDQVEVFPYTSVTDNANKDDKEGSVKDGKEGSVKDGKEGSVKDGKEGLVYGKRYSKEEDELVMNAVAEYIESHNLGDEGLNMVLNCGAHSEARNCWKEIQAAIPWRPLYSVYHRAHILFERDEKHPWTPEELDIVQKFVEKHGRKWKLLADSLGKHRHHVKDTWRRIKLTNANKGRWSQEEYQNLFDLVNLDLSMKASQERLSKHGMLRDNICWTAISDKMETRPFVSCCIQWYRKLTSPMVAEGIWADADDYRMLDALSSRDACCMEDVDWDHLLENRSGDLCRKRWGQMVRHLGPNKDMSFAEQVDVLANRFRPDMVEARETYDSKRPIDLP
ncbi:hypothetical protein HRI_005213600 [Hibiscus trionum]|uniref:Uncharacterized protein n=1 Tax=Hibiscus trionum TaxID=183268 RepID=A0A9W7MU29_HIBTR|nr:hypothetical protein HRI_005213600 [Hibiscus trionum]